MRKHICSFLFLFAFVGCYEKAEPPQPVATKKAVLKPKYQSVVLTVSAEKMREAMLQSHRLKPDHRLLLAFQEIDRTTGKVPGDIHAEFTQDKWKIFSGKTEIGVTSAYPDFPELLGTLTAYAKRTSGFKLDPSNSTSVETPFLGPEVLQSLALLDESWKKGPNQQTLRVASVSLASLAIQSKDVIEMSEGLPARALAILAMRKAFVADQADKEECLIAHTLGYTRHSENLAKKLSATDAARLYVLKEDEQLAMAAHSASATNETKYFYLCRLAQLNRSAEWLAEVRKLFPKTSFAVLNTSLYFTDTHQMESFDVAGLHASIATQELRELGGGDDLESSLKKLSVRSNGPFGGSEIQNDYYRASYYSLFSDEHSGSPAKRQKEGVGAQFARWKEGLKNSHKQQYGFDYLFNDVRQLTSIGGLPLMRLTNEFVRNNDVWANPALAPAAAALALRLDSRPAHCYAFGTFVDRWLMDLRLTGELYESVLDRASALEPDTAKSAYFLGKDKFWQDFVRSQRINAYIRADVLYSIASYKGADQKIINESYDRLIQENPHSWEPVNLYLEALRKDHNYKKACEITDRFIRAQKNDSAEGYYHARIKQSTNYHLAGRPQDGIAVLEPIKDSIFARRQMAILLADVGKKAEAEEMASEAMSDHVNDLETRLAYVGILWRNGKNADAAKVLLTAPRTITDSDWCWTVAEKFGESFQSAHPSVPMQALAELQKAHVSKWNLSCFPRPFADAGRNDIAFTIASSFVPQHSHDMEEVIEAYRYLALWKGKSEANTWLQRTIPPERLNPLSAKAFYKREYDLLWDAIKQPAPSDHPEWVWLFRAAASAMIGPADPHRKELSDYYSQKLSGKYHLFGRYLIGLSSEKELFALPSDADTKCETAFYMAVKAHGVGDFNRASDLYRVCLETGATRTGPYNHALTILNRWRNSGQGLFRAQADKL